MTTQKPEMLIAFGIDASYAPHLAVVVTSIVANSKAPFRFMVMHDGVPDQDRQKIESCAPGRKFDWVEITDERLLNFPKREHISRATYYRFLIPDFAPTDIKRVIYLDSDLVVLGDVEELFRFDLGDNMIGAVHDGGLKSQDFAQRWNLPELGRLSYFNAGVLVLDTEKIRATNAFGPAVEIVDKHWDALRYGDQDVLNLIFWGKWTRLPAIWNVQRRMALNEWCSSTPEEHMHGWRPKIIHFTEDIKPWLKTGYHPFIWMYYRYLLRTPYWSSVNKQAGNSVIRHAGRYVKTTMKMARLKT